MNFTCALCVVAVTINPPPWQRSNRSARLAARPTGVQRMDKVKPTNACVSLTSPHPRRIRTGIAVDLERAHAAFEVPNIG
jgi:hypothetical protein